MDYILAAFFAIMAAAVYSAFALFINAGGRRPAYRIAMWVYIATLFAADVATVTLNLPSGYVIFGSLISAFVGVFTQIAVAVKLGHLQMVNAGSSSYPRYTTLSSTIDDINNSANSIHYGANDPLRNR